MHMQYEMSDTKCFLQSVHKGGDGKSGSIDEAEAGIIHERSDSSPVT